MAPPSVAEMGSIDRVLILGLEDLGMTSLEFMWEAVDALEEMRTNPDKFRKRDPVTDEAREEHRRDEAQRRIIRRQEKILKKKENPSKRRKKRDRAHQADECPRKKRTAGRAR